MRQREGQAKKTYTSKGSMIILFIATIICGLVIQAGLALEKTALHPDYYRKLLDDPELHEYIWKSLWQGFTGQEKLPDSDSAVYTAFRKSFDDQWIKEQLGRVIAEALDFVKGAEPQLIVTLDIREKKEIFRRELLNMAGQPATSGLAASLKGFLQGDTVPDRHILISINSPSDLGPRASQSLAALQKARLWFKYLPYAAYGLLLLPALFWGSLGSGLRWFGGGILTSGFIFTIITALLHKLTLVQSLLQNTALLKPLFTDYPELMFKAIAAAQDMLMRGALLQAAAGLLVIGTGFAVEKITKKMGSKAVTFGKQRKGETQ